MDNSTGNRALILANDGAENAVCDHVSDMALTNFSHVIKDPNKNELSVPS